MTKTLTRLILGGGLALSAFLLAPASLTSPAPARPALAGQDADDHDSLWPQPWGNTATPIVVDEDR